MNVPNYCSFFNKINVFEEIRNKTNLSSSFLVDTGMASFPNKSQNLLKSYKASLKLTVRSYSLNHYNYYVSAQSLLTTEIC